MNQLNRAWYLLIALAALAPAGWKVATWRPAPKPQPLDDAMVQAGETLFNHKWTEKDPLAVANGGDGLGPVFNANSCATCHHKGGVGGSGGNDHNVTVFTVRPATGQGKSREGVVHASATKKDYQENLALADSRLPPIERPTLTQVVALRGSSNHCIQFPQGIHVSQRNTPALFGAKLIDEIPERVIVANQRGQQLKWGMAPSDGEDVPVGRALRLADGRLGRFGWKAQSASLSDFVQAACANELGLSNPGQAQPRPLGQPGYQSPGYDLTLEQCNQLTSFCASLPRPAERLPGEPLARENAEKGKKLFRSVGCADCHTPDLGSVEGIYSDLLLHRMGQPLEGGGSYNEPPLPRPDGTPGDGPSPGEWRTPPLWGVADSAPYLHDGRAANLEEAIEMHGGQGTRSAQRFKGLAPSEQTQLIAFLKSLKAP
jgi:CxxC motif-containing protein (DUF1111 family)